MAIAEGKNSWRLELVQAHRVTLALSSWGDSTVTTQPATYSSALETSSLVGSDELLGMVVYDSAGHKIGRIERVMIDRVSGKVVYAIVSFGGFIGIGEHQLARERLGW